MKKSIRIVCLLGALLLIGLVLASLVFAFLDVAWAGSAAISCIFAALFLSVLLFGVLSWCKHIQNKEEEQD